MALPVIRTADRVQTGPSVWIEIEKLIDQYQPVNLGKVQRPLRTLSHTANIPISPQSHLTVLLTPRASLTGPALISSRKLERKPSVAT